VTRARVFGRPVPLLRDRPPRRRGVGGVEALSSYISAQALDCHCAPFTLFSEVLIPAKKDLRTRWQRVRFGESHLINGYTDIASAVAASVDTCAGINFAREMTFLGLKDLCDPIGKHFMHLTRPWCGACYLEARSHGIPAWDPLYSYVRTSKVCVWHKAPFLFMCAKCNRGQRFLPKFPFLDHCEHCGADLAIQAAQDHPDGQSLDEHLWFAQAALDTIWHMSRGEALTAEHFGNNVLALMNRHFKGKERPFAVRLGIAGSGPKNWTKRGSAPTWASLVDLAHRLEIPPAQLGSAEATLTDPQYWRHRPAAALDQPHLRPAKALLRQVRAELRKEPVIIQNGRLFTVESLNALARRLNIKVALVKRHFPEETQKSIADRRHLRTLLRMEGIRERDERLHAAAAAVKQHGLPLTERNLKRTGLLKVSDLVQKHKS
jgi:hypothetical protein